MKNSPPYLYKILSVENWHSSQNKKSIQLPSEDAPYIHLATEEQLNKIIHKFWSTVPVFFILKLDTTQLKGKLVLESNPGGSHKYYHLYEGSIPLESVVDFKKFTTHLNI